MRKVEVDKVTKDYAREQCILVLDFVAGEILNRPDWSEKVKRDRVRGMANTLCNER